MSFFMSRLMEPSTYAGLGALLALFGVHLDAGLVSHVTTVVGAVSAVAGMALPEVQKLVR